MIASTAVLVNVRKLHPVKILVSGVPQGALLSAGSCRGDGTWELTPHQLTGLRITPPADCDADIDLLVRIVSMEVLNGSAVQSVETRRLRVEIDAALDFASAAACPGFGHSLSSVG